MVLLVGCQSPQSPRDDDTARIASSLERCITNEEARRMILNDIDLGIQGKQAQAPDPRELVILAKNRKAISSRLESFLARSRSGDQLWVYRTYVAADWRGGESGLALVRAGTVVEHMRFIIYD
jgi:hypothetical protein